MYAALHRTTKQYLTSVKTHQHPLVDWIPDPDMSAVTGQPSYYWKITGETVSLMNQAEQDVVDLARRNAYLVTVEDFLDERSSAQGAYNTLLFKELNKLRVKNGDSPYSLAQLKTSLRNEVS